MTEILDGAGFPLSRFTTIEEFSEWNRTHRLIDNGSIGRHTKLFVPEDPEHVSELQMILTIVGMRYPETRLFIGELKAKTSLSACFLWELAESDVLLSDR